MEPNINCFYDESSYISPNAFITETDDENLEYSHLWDDYIDYRTFYNGEAYIFGEAYKMGKLTLKPIKREDEVVDDEQLCFNFQFD